MKFNEFVFIILWMGIMALFFHYVKVEEPMTVLGKKENRTALWAAVLVIIPLVIMTANRGDFADSFNYHQTYDRMPSAFGSMLDYLTSFKKDVAFYFLTGFIKVIFKQDYVFYFFVLALIQTLSLVKIYRRYSIDYVMSIFLFIASTDYISWMFNGIRQFTAVTIIFAGTTWLLEKKYIPYILLIIFASTFHQSALLMIPITFIVSGGAWNKRTIMLLIAALLIVAYVEVFTNILDELLEETQYENVVSDWKSWNDDGTNPLRVLVYCIPAIISFVGRKIIRYENDTLINLCTNMSIVTAGLYLVSMVTSGIFIGRLPIYTSLFNYILLPWEIKNLFNERSKSVMLVALYSSYLFFYVYQMHFQSNLF